MPASKVTRFELPNSPRKRGYGEGSIFVDGSYWKSRVVVVDVDGTKRRETKNHKTWQEAEKYLDDVVRTNALRKKSHPTQRVESGESPTGIVSAFGVAVATLYGNQSQEVVDGNRAPATLDDYNSIWSRLEEYFDWLPVPFDVNEADYTPASAEDVIECLERIKFHAENGIAKLSDQRNNGKITRSYTYEELRVMTGPTHKPLSPSRRNVIYLNIKKILPILIEMGSIEPFDYLSKVNLSVKVQLPAVENVALDERRAKIIIAFLDSFDSCEHGDNLCKFRWLLALEGGNRQAENLALCHDDIFESVGPDGNPEYYYLMRKRLRAGHYRHGCPKNGQGKPSCGQYHAYRCPDVQGGYELIDGTKGGKSVVVKRYMPPKLAQAYIDHKRLQADELAAIARDEKKSKEPLHPNRLLTKKHRFVFTTNPASRWPGKFYSPRWDLEQWKNIQERALLWAIETNHPLAPNEAEFDAWLEKPARLHGIRHRAASKMARNPEVDMKLMMNQLGHKSVATTLRYTHISDDDLRRIGSLTE